MSEWTKDKADKLGNQLGKDRTGWDGKTPLNEKDRRFYGLREAGYKGWIDQDGYPQKGDPL